MTEVDRIYSMESLIVDLFDGSPPTWREIQSMTGLGDERCKEMANEIQDLLESYFKRNS